MAYVLNDHDRKEIVSWWGLLEKKPGWRAELKRAETPGDVLLCQGFHYLYSSIPGYWASEYNMLGLAAVAGVLSHIRAATGKSFACSCASPSKNGNKPIVSELRFSQLQKSRTLDELYIRLIRILHLLKNSTDPASVAESILHWFTEMINGEYSSDPRSRIHVRWGLEYFQNLPKP